MCANTAGQVHTIVLLQAHKASRLKHLEVLANPPSMCATTLRGRSTSNRFCRNTRSIQLLLVLANARSDFQGKHNKMTVSSGYVKIAFAVQLCAFSNPGSQKASTLVGHLGSAYIGHACWKTKCFTFFMCFQSRERRDSHDLQGKPVPLRTQLSL